MTNSLPGYDSWKTHNPEDDLPDHPDHPDCTCSRSLRSRRNCPVHGIDPDTAFEERRDRFHDDL